MSCEAATRRQRVDALLVRIAHEDAAAGVTRDVPDLEMLVKVADHRGAEDRRYARRNGEDA